MRGIAIGDLHSGLVYRGISFNNRISKCLSQVQSYVENNKPDIVVILGDIFHNMFYSIDAIIFVLRWLKKLNALGIRVFVLEGNHDKKKFYNDTKCIFNLLQEFDFENIKLVEGKIWYRLDKKAKYVLMFIPYLDKSDLPEEYTNVQKFLDDEAKRYVEQLSEKYKNFKFCIFSHLSVSGAKVGSEIELISSADINVPEYLLKSKKVKYIINGHIHLPQELGKVKIPGSIESFRFGEGYKRFFLEFEL